MDSYERLAEQMDIQALDETAWVEDPTPDDSSNRGLAVAITVRLDERTAERLRKRAVKQGIGYTTLLRLWVQERLDQEDQTS